MIVSQGSYPDSIVITNSVVLMGAPPVDMFSPGAFPVVGRVRIAAPTTAFVTISGFHMQGPVRQAGASGGNKVTAFAACRLDSGIVAGSDAGGTQVATVRMHGCTVTGGADLFVDYVDVSGSTFLGGGLSQQAGGVGMLRGNVALGPGTFGIRSLGASSGSLEVSDNLVQGTAEGIVGDGDLILGNTIAEAGIGIDLEGFGASGTVATNVVRRTGAAGIVVGGTHSHFVVTSNSVDTAGTAGIHQTGGDGLMLSGNTVRHSGDPGVWAQGPGLVSQNIVLGAGGDGIRSETATVRANVVGRSQRAGIVVVSAADVSGNTSYENGAEGYLLNGTSADTIAHNIAFGNTGYGLAWTGGSAPVPACNDWYANAGGAAIGIATGPSDLAVDPQFCNVPGDSVTLASTSPLLDAPGCGQVGARGEGCASPASVPSASATALRFSVAPIPSSGHLRFSLPAQPTAARLDVYDVTGARRWGTVLDPRRTSVEWDGTDLAGHRLPAGTYYAYWTSAAGSSASRIVLVR
ncbi:MAG TPA: right-handed parallel beta-helix repeat-containing protein [Candidatus Eisenbacteria bacterium]|nr:right-handed parallel beta-helix repeat-containing protein [Candidatus Eisenbacteria bacterium]